MNEPHLLLLEDDAPLGDTLSRRLGKEGLQVHWCPSLQQARDELRHFRPDVAILDISLPDGSGFELGRELKQSGVPVLFLTAMNSPEFRLEAFEMGADDYIPKPFHLKELLLRLDKLLERSTLPGEVRNEGLVVNLSSFEVTALGRLVQLTAKEAQLLAVLLHKSPAVVSREEILQIWSAGEGASARTIDNAVSKIRHELLPLLRENPIESVRGKGYRWVYRMPESAMTLRDDTVQQGK